MPIKNFIIDDQIAEEEGIIIASYRCPDKECGCDHVIGTIDSEWKRDFPEVFKSWQKWVSEAVLALGREILKKNGLKATTEKVVNVRDLN